MHNDEFKLLFKVQVNDRLVFVEYLLKNLKIFKKVLSAKLQDPSRIIRRGNGTTEIVGDVVLVCEVFND